MTKTQLLLQMVRRLYFVPPKDRMLISQAIQAAPKSELTRIEGQLKAGIAKQDTLLKKLIEHDAEFPQKLHTFMKTKYGELQKEYEIQEQGEADSILDID